MLTTTNKARFDAFSGVATKYNEVKGTSQANIIGAADVYVSSFGNHVVVLNRFQRDNAVLALDPEYVGVAWLRPIQQKELAATGDSEKRLLLGEYSLVVQNEAAHGKVQGVGA
jgi:hypothetical protein